MPCTLAEVSRRHGNSPVDKPFLDHIFRRVTRAVCGRCQERTSWSGTCATLRDAARLRPRRSCLFLSGAARPGRFSDSRISRKDEFAGTQGCFLEIRCIGWKHLPSGYRFPQYLNRSHLGKLTAQAVVMLFARGKPHSVICDALRLVAEDQNDFVFHVNGEAAEHWPSVRRQRSDRVEDELVRNGLALLERESGTSQRRVSARLRHHAYDICAMQDQTESSSS